MATAITTAYRVGDEDDITFRVTIGDAQKGVSTVRLGTEQLAHNAARLELNLGKGKDLKGKKLFCTTTVTDVRTETNRTSVTYAVEGGPNNFEETLAKTVESHGDVVFYTAEVFFFGS